MKHVRVWYLAVEACVCRLLAGGISAASADLVSWTLAKLTCTFEGASKVTLCAWVQVSEQAREREEEVVDANTDSNGHAMVH